MNSEYVVYAFKQIFVYNIVHLNLREIYYP
jgi:hypothetical protein